MPRRDGVLVAMPYTTSMLMVRSSRRSYVENERFGASLDSRVPVARFAALSQHRGTRRIHGESGRGYLPEVPRAPAEPVGVPVTEHSVRLPVRWRAWAWRAPPRRNPRARVRVDGRTVAGVVRRPTPAAMIVSLNWTGACEGGWLEATAGSPGPVVLQPPVSFEPGRLRPGGRGNRGLAACSIP